MIKLRSDSLFWRESEAEIIALDATASRYFSANASGAALWGRLEAGATEADLVETLCQRYGVSRDVAADAVTAFLVQLDERGLLERDAAG